MDVPQHILPDEILLAYSAGTLCEAFALVVAAQVSLCDETRSRLEAFDSIGGSMVDTAEPADLSEDALAATLARIDGRGKSPIVTAVRRGGTVLPGPVRSYVGGDLDRVHWRPVGMGVKQAILHAEGPVTARLILIPAGVAMPTHSHGGTEMTLVLQGAYRDGDAEFRRGEVEVADQDVRHAPVAIGDEDCICLSAANARLRFTSLIPRLAQPFFRI